MHLRLCATCRLVQVRSFLSSQRLVRKYQATSAIASSNSNSPGEQSSGAVQQAQNQSRLQQHEASAWPALDLKRLHSQSPSVRVRQHLNPFTPKLQVPVPPLDWDNIYIDASRPLAVDIGCGPGRFPLALGAKLSTYNILGIDIREKLIDRATTWSKLSGCQQTMYFCTANATVSLQSMLSSYPGPIELITIQFPDPHWKLRNRKKRIVQPQLVEAVAQLMAPGGRVFLQSDVQEVVVSMRDDFEFHGKGAFGVGTEHSQHGAVFYTDQMTVDALPRDSLERQAWKPTWQEEGWLLHNPLGVPTEREVHTEKFSDPVYRVMLSAVSGQVPQLSGQVEDKSDV